MFEFLMLIVAVGVVIMLERIDGSIRALVRLLDDRTRTRGSGGRGSR